MFRTMSDAAQGPSSGQGVKFVVMGVLLALACTVALSAWAHPAGDGPQGGPPPRAALQGPHGGGFGGPGLFLGAPERIDRSVDRLLHGLDASDAQRSQVKQIVRAAAADLRAQHESAGGLHEQGLQLFAAPVVDARAVENLRQQGLAQHDQASKRMTQAMLDVAAVLTPEQRVKLTERISQRRQQMKDRLQNRMMERRGAASDPTR